MNPRNVWLLLLLPLTLNTAQAVLLDDEPAPAPAVKPKPKAKPKPRAESAPVAESRAAGSSYRDCADCPEMVVIPGGSFMMGSSSIEQDGQDDEKPRHEVSIKRFALGKYEISKLQFAAFIDATGYNPGNSCKTNEGGKWEERSGRNWLNPAYSQAGNHPVVCVSADDAEVYAQWLSRKTGKHYRLPTEAEWEYAVRAGTDTSRFWGDSPDQACQYANVADLTLQQAGWNGTFHQCQDGYEYTAPVGSYRANAFGLYDMLGNVWEWTCSASSSYGSGGEKACTNDANSKRVDRGGSWNNGPAYVRSANRDGDTPSNRDSNLGFRLAQDS